MRTKYQNSVCKQGWLHKWNHLENLKGGSLERCERCGLQKHFPINYPNHLYLSWHIRSILRKSDTNFSKEYPGL